MTRKDLLHNAHPIFFCLKIVQLTVSFAIILINDLELHEAHKNGLHFFSSFSWF